MVLTGSSLTTCNSCDSHFKEELYLSNNELSGTLPTELGNMTELSKLLCTHYPNSLMDLAFCMFICKSLLWIYVLKMEIVNWLISQCLQVMFFSHFKGFLYISNNELTGTLPTEIGYLTHLGKLLCLHCLYSLMDFIFCTIICKSLLLIYDLTLESVNWLISHRIAILLTLSLQRVTGSGK